MRPRLCAPYFGPSGPFHRMAHVLAYTASQHCQGWDVLVKGISPAPLTSALNKASHVHNTQKMEFWASCVEKAPDGTPILLIDADTMILRPLDDLWDRPFDLAYTTKQSRFPFNSGVVFLRVNPGTRAFIDRWRQENLRLLGDRNSHMPWRRKYGGINQASLGYALEHNLTGGLHILELPCAEWNCEDSAWASFSPATRIVHLKSALRRAVFEREIVHEYLRPLVKLWDDLERQSVSRPSLLAS